MNASNVRLGDVIIDGKDAGQIVVHSETTIEDVMRAMGLTDISHSGSMDSSGNFIFTSKIALTFYNWKKSLDPTKDRVTNDQWVIQVVGIELFHDSVFFAPSPIDNRYYFGFSKSAFQFGKNNLSCGVDALINFVNSSIYFFGTTPGIFNLQKSLIYDTKSSIGFIPSGILCDGRLAVLDFNVILEFVEYIKIKSALKLSKDVRERLDMYLNCKSWPQLLAFVPRPVEPVVELVDRPKLLERLSCIGTEDSGLLAQIIGKYMSVTDDMEVDVYDFPEKLCKELWECFGETEEMELFDPVESISCFMEVESVSTIRSVCFMDVVESEFVQICDKVEAKVRKVFRKRQREGEDTDSHEDEHRRLSELVRLSTNVEITAIIRDCSCGNKKAKTIVEELFKRERVSEDLYDELNVIRRGWKEYLDELWEEYN